MELSTSSQTNSSEKLTEKKSSENLLENDGFNANTSEWLGEIFKILNQNIFTAKENAFPLPLNNPFYPLLSGSMASDSLLAGSFDQIYHFLLLEGLKSQKFSKLEGHKEASVTISSPKKLKFDPPISPNVLSDLIFVKLRECKSLLESSFLTNFSKLNEIHEFIKTLKSPIQPKRPIIQVLKDVLTVIRETKHLLHFRAQEKDDMCTKCQEIMKEIQNVAFQIESNFNNSHVQLLMQENEVLREEVTNLKRIVPQSNIHLVEKLQKEEESHLTDVATLASRNQELTRERRRLEAQIIALQSKLSDRQGNFLTLKNQYENLICSLSANFNIDISGEASLISQKTTDLCLNRVIDTVAKLKDNSLKYTFLTTLLETYLLDENIENCPLELIEQALIDQRTELNKQSVRNQDYEAKINKCLFYRDKLESQLKKAFAAFKDELQYLDASNELSTIVSDAKSELIKILNFNVKHQILEKAKLQNNLVNLCNSLASKQETISKENFSLLLEIETKMQSVEKIDRVFFKIVNCKLVQYKGQLSAFKQNVDKLERTKSVLEANCKDAVLELERLKESFVAMERLKDEKVSQLMRSESIVGDMRLELEELERMVDLNEKEKMNIKKMLEDSDKKRRDLESKIQSLRCECEEKEANIKKQSKELEMYKLTKSSKGGGGGPTSESEENIVKETLNQLIERSRIKKIIVTFTGFRPGNSRDDVSRQMMLAGMVQKLGGLVHLGTEFSENITHIISPPCYRSIRVLAASLTSKWIVSGDWIEQSVAAGYFISEHPFGFLNSERPFRYRSLWMSPSFSEEFANDPVWPSSAIRVLVEKLGKGRWVENGITADFLLISTKESAEPGFNGTFLHLNDFLDMIPTFKNTRT